MRVPPFSVESSTQSLLAAIVDSSDDAIVSKSLDGIITSWNRGAERIFGWTVDEVVGQPITIIIPPALHDQEVEILKRLRLGQRIDHLETVRTRKSGEQIDVSLTISPIRDTTGTIVGASKVARDISDRKQAEAKLKAAYEQLEERVAARTAALRKSNQDLLRQAETVRKLSTRLLELQDEERGRISRELHDGVGQLLVAANMAMSIVSKATRKLRPEVTGSVKELAGLVKDALDEVRTVSHLLHPPLLDEVGLESGVRDFIKGFAERSNVHARFVMSPGFKRLGRDYELLIFHVVQECLTSIYRHPVIKSANVRLSQADGRVRCEIGVSGRDITGNHQLKFDSAAFGLNFRGMRERVSQLGGSLEKHSNSRETNVVVELPVNRNPSRHRPVRR